MIQQETVADVSMSAADARDILIDHNKWRRGEDSVLHQGDPARIGRAIDVAIAALQAHGEGVEAVPGQWPSVCDSDRRRLEWCASMLTDIAKGTADDPKKYALQIRGAISTVLQPNIEPPDHPPAAQAVPDGWTALHDVATERQRQIGAEGWTPEHDDEHANGDLARAAASYVAYAAESDAHRSAKGGGIHLKLWPWDWSWWKPKTRRHDLVRAAALIVAEIERLDRKSETPATPPTEGAQGSGVLAKALRDADAYMSTDPGYRGSPFQAEVRAALAAAPAKEGE